MNFLIADTFTDSLARLTGEEQKAVKTTAFDLQVNPASPGLKFHKLDKAKDKNFWSVRVGRDIRLIVHKTDGSLLLCYTNHHDKAYEWAERRRLETHPKTGAAQLVEIRETIQKVLVPIYVQSETPKPARTQKTLFSNIPEEELLSYGVPPEWVGDVLNATEDNLLILADRLPSEASEALLELATGGKPRITQASAATTPFDHPDAQRRFRVMTNLEELERALEFPWDKWSVFLHPEQRHFVERNYAGPARVSGSAGTGKTIVALHRAVSLARANPNTRVLLTTFSHILANALRTKLRRLISNEPRLAERLEVHSINAIGGRLYKSHFGQAANLAPREVILELLTAAAKEIGNHKFSQQFLFTEWEHVVDAWQLATWESYRDVARLGRKTRLPEPQRIILWSIFERVRAGLTSRKMITPSEMFTKLATTIAKSKASTFDFAVVDEAQDISVAHLRFLAALGTHRPDALFFAGDLGQRIFQQPFSWLSLGVDIRGRSRSLRVNYRTSHQIRMQADRLLGPEVSDVDGNVEQRGDTVSVFNGPAPEIQTFKKQEQEIGAVAKWISSRLKEGLAAHEFGIFVRSPAELERACCAVKQSGLEFKILDENVEPTTHQLAICTMHLAKGLEFRAVVVMACDDEIIPLQERIESVGDDADLQEVYDTERHLLYVACTRARDHLLVTSVEPASEFLDDMRT
ncbi:MAG: DEAD/DEAH box helicase [Verrucomicrobia bacterium]|nr:DEAD/DEAH box helicase [Verrucomicrobiota bacterium]